MSYGEAMRHTKTLAADPSAMLCAALSGWDHPVTRETVVLMDLYDLHHHIAWAQAGGKGKAPKPYPRPWALKSGAGPTKPDKSLTQAQIIEVLRKAGHTAPLPT